MSDTKEIEYAGRVERYEIVDGYLEMFVGYVHKAFSSAELGAAAEKSRCWSYKYDPRCQCPPCQRR